LKLSFGVFGSLGVHPHIESRLQLTWIARG